MESVKKIALIALMFASFSSYAEESCAPVTKEYQQCSFTSSTLNHGESTTLLHNGVNSFSGSITAQCRFGTIAYSDESCEPESKLDCAINETSWGPSGAQCQHDAKLTPLSNGSSIVVPASVGDGSVTYSCSAGELTISDKSCDAASYDDTTGFDAEVKTQTADWVCTSSGATNDSACLLWATSCTAGTIDSGLLQVPSGETPTDSFIKSSTCTPLEFGTMDSYTTPRIEDQTASYDYYSMKVSCSAYYGSQTLLDSCEADVEEPGTVDECQGDQVPTTSTYPKMCSGTGSDEVCYENLCAVSDTSPDVCVDCDGPVSFTDTTTGNSCSVTVSDLASAVTESVEFMNSSYNGVADVFCNDGSATASGTCYKSCASSTLVTWNDENDVPSCGQMIPDNADGYYTQGAVVSLGTSIDNTGTATATCNDGNWEVSGGSCELDCSGTVNWGSGLDSLGQSKSNLCSASTATTTDGGSLTVTNTTSGATGSVSLTCDNGEWSKSNEVCNTGCELQTVTWGGLCQDELAQKENGETGYLVGSNDSYVYSWSISGSATATCEDGKVTLSDETCLYLLSQTVSDWSDWTESSRTCTVSPDAATISDGLSFLQTKTCSIDEYRTRTSYNNWSDGTSVATGTETETDNYEEVTTQTAVGEGQYLFWSTPSVFEQWTGTKSPTCNITNSTYLTEKSGQCYVEGEINEFLEVNSSTCVAKYYEQECVASEEGIDVVVDADYRIEFEYGAWVCGSWSPDASTVDLGTTFTSTQTCTRSTVLGYDKYTLYASGAMTFLGKTITGSRDDTKTNTQQSVGTKAIELTWGTPVKVSEYTTLMSMIIGYYPANSDGVYDGSPESSVCTTEGEVFEYTYVNYTYQVPSPSALAIVQKYEVTCN